MNSLLIATNKYVLFIAATLFSMALCTSAIPRIIYISKKKKLYDLPDNDRKLHSEVIPNLGGVAIYLGFSVIGSLFVKTTEFDKWNYIIAATLILFITGIKDDLINVNPSKKFIAQIAASFIIAFLADIRLDNLHGFLGVFELPYWVSLVFTVVGCTFVSNAFNLIDGIDGLAATIAIISTLFLGIAFNISNNISLACISFSLMGAIIAFLKFNIQPARIFMGDCGSLVIGFTIAVLAILLTKNVHHFEGNVLFHSPKAVLLGALSILFIPVFDTFRVFAARIIKGNSPFNADRTHLHHYFLDLGFSHTKTVFILATVSIFIIVISFLIQDFPVNICILAMLFGAIGLYLILFLVRKNKLDGDVSCSPKSKPIL
jgi:UDP-GlcNAc:undecaprenyl-phosphate/decaprenyl-phosphate GlcNAc-1-phosphate transferase